MEIPSWQFLELPPTHQLLVNPPIPPTSSVTWGTPSPISYFRLFPHSMSSFVTSTSSVLWVTSPTLSLPWVTSTSSFPWITSTSSVPWVTHTSSVSWVYPTSSVTWVTPTSSFPSVTPHILSYLSYSPHLISFLSHTPSIGQQPFLLCYTSPRSLQILLAFQTMSVNFYHH